MGSRFNGVSISSTRVAPKAALSYDSAFSGIRAPLTVDESDFEYSASSKSRRNSTTSSYYSGSEPESEGFASGEDEGILEDTHYVEKYTFSRPFLKNSNSERVQKSRSYEDASFRPSVKRPWREIVEESVSNNGNVFVRASVRDPNDRSYKGFRTSNEYDGLNSDEEIFEDGDSVSENGDFRPAVAAANEEVSENESSSVVDIEILLMPTSIIPIAQVSRDSDDDSQASEVLEDDGFSGVARVLSIEVLQRLDSSREVSILEVEEEEAHESLAENMDDTEFVGDLVVRGHYLNLKHEEQAIDGVVSAQMIQNKGLGASCEVSAGSLVSQEGHKSLLESEWNGDLMLDEEFEVDERKFVGLDHCRMPTDLAENTMLLGNFPCDVTSAEPRCPSEIVKLMELEIPELDNGSGMVEVYVDRLVSDNGIQSENLEQKCKQKFNHTVETRTCVTLDQGVQMDEGLIEGCPRLSYLPDVFTNDKHVSQEATHKEENNEPLYGEAENPTSPADVNAMVADMEEQEFTPFSGGEILQDHSLKIDGQMATGSGEAVNLDDKFSVDSAGHAACFMDNTGVVSDGEMNQFASVEARNSGAPPRMNIALEETLSEAQKHKLEIVQQIRIKYLQLLRRLGMFPENSIAAKVLYHLAVAESRFSSQEFHFDSDKKVAKELEVQSKNDLNFSVSILVIGKTGVGKSATINSIFGERKTVIDAFEPATTDVKEIIGTIDGVRVEIFDTPGLRPSLIDQSHNRKVLLSIKKIMQKSPPDIVLYIDRLDMQTNNFDDLPLLKLVTTYLGSSIWHKAIISLTHSSSIPPDGSNGDPVSYEVFVFQRSYSVQQMISHSGGESLVMNPGMMIPVALVENHTFSEKIKCGEKPMHIIESWKSHLLLLCYSIKILSEVNSIVTTQNPLDSGNLLGFKIGSLFDQEDDTSVDMEMGNSETGAVPSTDIELPSSFDSNKPSFRYYCSESSSQFLGGRVFGSHGWDHDLGYDGQFPAVGSVQLTKDTKEYNIQLHSSDSGKHKHKRLTMAGLDVQTTGVSITFLEDQITVRKRPTRNGNVGCCQTQTNAAYGASTGVRVRGKDYPIVKNQSSLSLSLRKWRGQVIWGCNLQSQFSSGRNSKLCIRVRAGLNNNSSWQSLSNHNTQSPEVTSRAVPSDEKIDDNLKTVPEKLSEAILDIHSKEDLVAEHARVAEEAVSGWERAENEVLVLKKQVDALMLKNSALEERIIHLDGALKECMRQLRQERESKEEKIYEVIAKKTQEWESKKLELENQITELHYQIQKAKRDALSNLESAEKENTNLRLELVSKSEELKQRTFERDLSTRAAETASKQHLDSIKKVAKLEAECNRLKMVARKVAAANDHQSVTASSVYVESFTDSQSDNGERISVIENDCCENSGLDMNYYGSCHHDSRSSSLVTIDRSIIVPSVEINLMDDFLEMERLVALPEMHSGGTRSMEKQGGENPLRSELEVMINRTAELEGIIERMDEDNVNLELALTKCQNQLKTSENQLKETMATLLDFTSQLSTANESKEALQREVEFTKLRLKNSMKRFDEADVKLLQIQSQLAIANEAKSMCEVQLEDANIEKAEVESKLRMMELEQETLRAKVSNLQDDVQKEKKFSKDIVGKCAILETDISKLKVDSQLQRSTIAEEFRINQDKELAIAVSKFAACQNTIASLGLQLKSLATLEDLMMDPEELML